MKRMYHDRANFVIYWLMVVGAVIVFVGLLIVWAERADAAIGDGTCNAPSIEPNTPTLEAADNTQGGTEYNVTGVLSIQNPAAETTITEQCNKKGLNCKLTSLNLPPKAHLTLHLSNGVDTTYTIDAGSTFAVPYVLSEDNAFWSAAVESDEPLNCIGSAFVVNPAR